jgi:hypothetical protein
MPEEYMHKEVKKYYIYIRETISGQKCDPPAQNQSEVT